MATSEQLQELRDRIEQAKESQRPKALTNQSMQPRGPRNSVERQNRVNARAEGAQLDSDEIVAKPLMMPGVNNIKLKNSNIAIRWVNCQAKNGLQYQRWLLAGFVNATEADVEIPGIAFKNGAFINGDVLLMKIDRKLYLGACKLVSDVAKARVSRQAILQKGRNLVKETLANPTDEKGNSIGVAPQELRNKIQAFIPPLSDIPGLTEEERETLADAQV